MHKCYYEEPSLLFGRNLPRRDLGMPRLHRLRVLCSQLMYPLVCQERHSILTDAGDLDCKVTSALFCCSFNASDQDCLGDAFTISYFQYELEGGEYMFLDSLCSDTINSSPTTAPSTASNQNPLPTSYVAPSTSSPAAAPTASLISLGLHPLLLGQRRPSFLQRHHSLLTS